MKSDEPKKTKQAVSIAVWHKDKLLILFRDKWLYEGTPWMMPGSSVDVGETPEQAANRELLEETGLNPPYGSNSFKLFKKYKTEWADELSVFELEHKFYSAPVSVQREYEKFSGELWLPTNDEKFLREIWRQLMPGLRMYLQDRLEIMRKYLLL